MSEWIVDKALGGRVSDDGMVVRLHLRLADGQEQILVMPVGQLDFMTRALLNLGNAAFDRQIATGRLAAASLRPERG
jgi:hypothetical protein